jgi:hypothetical protein
MLIIRETFITKPGQASKLAKLFRKAMPEGMRVMTDAVGNYNTVECEWEAASLADYEQQMKEGYSKEMDAHLKEEMKNYTDMYLTGKREIFRVQE